MTTPRRLSDRYDLGDLIGLGGMSEVHLARDLRLHRDVAIKLLRGDVGHDPDLNVRFQREAQNAAALNHPAIAAVYDSGEMHTPTGTLLYIVMEYVDGSTLRDVVHTSGPLPVRRAIEVIADACEALSFSHQRGIIHRDVKPANIMIGPAGAVKVVDFGIAKAIADSQYGVTQTGAVIGTAQYLSPEQARGDRVDARADVYSLGCVLYEICTGEPPFAGDSAVAVAYQHVRQEPVAPSVRNGEVPADLDAVVLKAMAKNPDNRYQTAADMHADLVRLQSGLTPRATSDQPSLTQRLPQAQPKTEERQGNRSIRRWLVAVAVLAVLAVVGTVAPNALRNDQRDVTAPDVRGQTSVSTGPAPTDAVDVAPLTVPDVSSLTYPEAIRKLTEAGFSRFQQAWVPSSSELKDRVMGTNPLANRTTASTNEITLVLGSGPTVPVP